MPSSTEAGTASPRRPARLPGRAARSGVAGWLVLTALLAIGALLVRPTGLGEQTTLEWQPELAASQPWRWWSAAWVHYSPMHLAANLTGAVLVAALGWAAAVRRDATIAWSLAWPLTHLALLLQPALRHYGGLSGVLHAGVAVVAVMLVASDPAPLRRWVGGLLLLGLVVKLLSESPWAGPLRHPPGWDIAVAPFAHLSGSLAGALCAGLLLALRGRV